MATFAIDTDPTGPHQTILTDLDGAQVGLIIDYNDRDDCWFLGLQDSGGNDIVQGVRLCVNVPLLQNVVVNNRPPGEFFVVDSTGKDLDPGFGELGIGKRVQLCYVEAADL